MKHYFWVGLFFIYFLIASVLYSPSLSGPWQYDDYAQILDNQVLTGRSMPKLLSSVFRFTAHSDGWTGTRDLVRASFLLNWKWWGTDPAGYRWINLLIHVVNSTLVAMLVSNRFSVLGSRFSVSSQPVFGQSVKTGKLTTGKQIPDNRQLKTDNWWIAVGAGLLFLVHPIQSQAVAYVAQRFTSMATMFYLLTIILYIRFGEVYETSRHRGNNFYNRYNRYKYYILALFSAVFAFNSKEIAVTLPVALALVTLIAAPKMSNATNKPINTNKYQLSSAIGAHWVIGLLGYWKLFILLLPFFLLSLKIPSQIISSSYSHTGQLSKLAEVAVDSLALKQKAVDLTRHDYFLTQINVVGTYLRLAVLPVKQTLDYDYPITKNFDPKTIILAVLHLGLIGGGMLWLFGYRFSVIGYQFIVNRLSVSRSKTDELKTGKPVTENGKLKTDNWRLIGLGVLWFYLTLLPESSVVPIADLIYEHRTYLPMVGLVIALAGAASAIYNNYNFYNRYKSYIAGAAIVWLLLLSGATLSRAWVWGNEVRLWGDIYQKAPNKPRANKNYGVVLAAAGKYEEGVKRLARAVELEPENADYWSNFGTAYLRWGKYEESAGKFLKAYKLFVLQHPSISSDPSNSSNSPKDLKQAAQYMNDYGVSMVQLQRGDEALGGFQKALKIDPTLYAAWLGLGAAYNIKGDSEMAIKTFFRVVADFPDQPDGYNNLAIVLKKAGRLEEAAAVLARMPKTKQ